MEQDTLRNGRNAVATQEKINEVARDHLNKLIHELETTVPAMGYDGTVRQHMLQMLESAIQDHIRHERHNANHYD
ncbi:MAG: hypothetical protein Q8R55_04700 [Candidatus Taylorbacteria bacterium]|nr:hypothetical protein [Candidatus Taylorbacteria bacterium]